MTKSKANDSKNEDEDEDGGKILLFAKSISNNLTSPLIKFILKWGLLLFRRGDAKY